MAYVSVAEWRPEQVTEWLKGLDNSIVSYIHWFSNNEVNGQQLLNLSPDELTHLGVFKLGHQELILEAVQHLRNFHYELDRENLQLLALKLSCAAHSLFSEIRDQAESSFVPTQIMADVANVIQYVKPLVSWLDRPPFAGQIQYTDFKSQLLSLSLEMATCAQRDRFAERPVAKIRTCSSKLAKLADSIIQDVTDPMILQPATLDLATIKKKVGEDLDFFLVPSFHGIHQIGDMKLSSPAHQSGKIQQGDEIVQVNYQTVVGWSRKKVLALFEESPNDLLLTLKRRPRHVKMYGQIYMKPYRLPSRKRSSPYSRWNDNLPSPRPELLTIPHFNTSRLLTINMFKKMENNQNISLEPSGTSSSSDEEFGQPTDSQSPASMRLYLPKPRASIQRRFTLSGPPRPSAQSEQFWRELQLERSWRSYQNNSQMNNLSAQNVASQNRNIDDMFQLRNKSASLGNSIATVSSRSTSCVPFSKARMGSVKFDLTKYESLTNDSSVNDKTVEERDKDASETDLKLSSSEVNGSKVGINKESDVNKISDSANHGTLTISELNKLKRDAFFNNMDSKQPQLSVSESPCKIDPEGSSERVKRVIENFKSEIIKTKKDMSEIDILKSPGKVMELIENFERKESRNRPEHDQAEETLSPPPPPPKSTRERSRLDKSCSTPAYDTSENIPLGSKINFLEEIKANQNAKAEKLTCSNTKDKLEQQTKILQKDDNLRTETTKEIQKTQVYAAVEDQNIGNKEVRFANNKITAKERRSRFENESRINSCISSTEQDLETANKRPVERQALQPLDVSYLASRQMSQSKHSLKSDYSVENFSDAHSVNSTRSDEISKPIPAQRKSKLPLEKSQNAGSSNNPCPLPPKPRSKPLPLSSEEIFFANQMPPEPPPRPESTFAKHVLSKNVGHIDIRELGDECHHLGIPTQEALESSSTSRKGNIIISSPVSTIPGGIPYDFKPLSAAPILSSKKTKSGSFPGSSSSASTEKDKQDKQKGSGSTLESLKAMLTLGKKGGHLNSPRSTRNKNAMLAKKRNVSVKEITFFEISGFLFYRHRKGSAIASWTKYYFILQGSNFYGFKTKESNKADLFIHLPGFTCTLAEEVKSKEFSFKIYHTGTVFYFAANSKEDLQQWLDSVNLAISYQDDKCLPELVTYSQTDSDSSDTEPEPETCFPTSPKMKKVLGSSPIPKPARSHQNLASDSKKTHDIQKRFGSLKKLGSQKHSSPNTLFSSGNESTEVASLDRKYLRFLGQKNSPTPVPTSRFRSYRRMQPPPVIPPKGKPKVKSKNLEDSSEQVPSSPPANNDPPLLKKKPLHSSNPSLIHPDMADYRITQERLAEFRRLRNQSGGPEPNRFVTLEQFLNRQDGSLRSNRNRPPEVSGFITLEQFLLCQEEERQRVLRQRERPMLKNNFADRGEEEKPKHRSKVYPGPNHPSTSSQVVIYQPKIIESDKPQVAPRSKGLLQSTSGKLKNVAMYQPPPIAHVGSASSQEDPIVMAFEIPLDQNEARKQTYSKTTFEAEFSKRMESNHSAQSPSAEYADIELPSTFEPETFTVQHMLKNKQKRGSKPKK